MDGHRAQRETGALAVVAGLGAGHGAELRGRGSHRDDAPQGADRVGLGGALGWASVAEIPTAAGGAAVMRDTLSAVAREDEVAILWTSDGKIVAYLSPNEAHALATELRNAAFAAYRAAPVHDATDLEETG